MEEKAYLYLITNDGKLKVHVGYIKEDPTNSDKTAMFIPIFPESGKKYLVCSREENKVYNRMVWSRDPNSITPHHKLLNYYNEKIVFYNKEIEICQKNAYLLLHEMRHSQANWDLDTNQSEDKRR